MNYVLDYGLWIMNYVLKLDAEFNYKYHLIFFR